MSKSPWYPPAVRILPIVTLLLACSACSRPERSHPAGLPDARSGPGQDPTASASTQPVPPASTASAELPELRIEARRGEKTRKPEAWLVSRELGFEKRVAEVPEPFVCRLRGWEQGAQVTCSPDARHRKATVETGPDALRLEMPGVAAVSIPLAGDAGVHFVASDVSARDLAGGACPADAKPRELDVRFLYHNDMETGGYLRLVVPRGGPGDVLVIELVHQRSGLGICRSIGTADQRELRCSDSKDWCSFRAGKEVLGYQCHGASAQEAEVLLPCGVRGRLVTDGVMGRGESYH